EGHVHAVVVLHDRRDRVAEGVPHVLPRGRMEDLGQIAPQHLQVAAEDGRRQRGDLGAGGVDDVDVAHVRGVRLQLVAQPHPVEGREVHAAAEVHRVAAATQRGRPFDDGDAVPVPLQPVSEGRPGDAGAGNQDLHAEDYTRVLYECIGRTYRTHV